MINTIEINSNHVNSVELHNIFTDEVLTFTNLDGQLYAIYEGYDGDMQTTPFELRDILRIKHMKTAERNGGIATQYAAYGEDGDIAGEYEEKNKEETINRS